jgi:hypothetical protein
MIYLDSLGIGFVGDSIARYDDEGSSYGPYTVWFERKFLCFYWAVTKPKRRFGIVT